MKACKGCGMLTVDPGEMPRYDVLNPEFDAQVDDMSDFGPYGLECWDATYTAIHMAG